MSSIKSFFDKYLPFPDRKRKHSEDVHNDCAPKSKFPRLTLRRSSKAPPDLIFEEPLRNHRFFAPHQQQQPSKQQRQQLKPHSSLPLPVPGLHPLPKPRGFFSGPSFGFRKPATIISKHSSRYGMDSIDLESDDDVELVEFLQTRDMSPGTIAKLAGRQNGSRPLPALIPRNKSHLNGSSCASSSISLSQPQAGPSRLSRVDTAANGFGGGSSNAYTLFKQRFNIASPQIRAKGNTSRGHQMVVKSQLQRSFAREEKQKYSQMCNGLAPFMASSSSTTNSNHNRQVKSSDGSLFGALQRIPFNTKTAINIGSRNRYGELLKRFSADIDPRRGLTSLRGAVMRTKPTTCVDLTKQNGTGPVVLTDDDDDEDDVAKEDDVEDAEDPIDLEADGNEVSFKIPKSFPCVHSLDNRASQKRTPTVTFPWQGARPESQQKSPRDILMALQNVDRDEEEVDEVEDDEDDDEIRFSNRRATSIVLDYDDEQAASTSQSSGTNSLRSQRPAEKVAPVNTLLDEWQVKPVFQEDWLEVTRRRYTEKQEQWSARIAEEQQRQEVLERESRQDVQDMIKKMDEAMLLREVIVVEDEEEQQKALAKAAEQQDTPLPAFNADQTSLIRYAAGRGSPDEVLVTKFNQSITRRDIATLLGDSWLNDEVINFYMNLLMERSEGEGYPKCYAMNTFFMPKVLQQGQSGVRRWTRKVDLFSYDVIPVPVHVSNIHWCMAIIHLKEKYIRYYDSMGQPNNRVLGALEQYLKDESMDKRKTVFCMEGWRKENMADCPRQMNGSDCGVFSCMFAEYVSRGHRINFTQDNMPYFRQKMILEICSGKLLL